MSWTDERVEQLSKLWLDGRSASQIAAEMGMGVTRNAVIGKVHRLGLAGRAKDMASLSQGRTRSKVGMRVRAEELETSDLVDTDVIAPLEIALAPFNTAPSKQLSDVMIPFSERVTIMDLRESSCRWPMGDPTHSEFRFCGVRTGFGSGPYCLSHSRMAFQPTQERRRDRVERFARIA